MSSDSTRNRPLALSDAGLLLVAESPIFRSFLDELERVAESEAAVLIEGEHGTGKSLAAARLHAASARGGGPLVEVAVAALAPTLVESELFGHEEGAFTGASSARLGRFRAAQGGTIVLDGIEGLSLELQAKLLRTLQEHVVEPLGGQGPMEVDFRLVATSARTLRAEVEAGRFREDLYYRLAVVTLRVPPLRARSKDIANLTVRLTERVAARAGVPTRPVDPEALARLEAHPWPGNVRELENTLERVMVLSPTPGVPGTPVAASELDFLDEALEEAADQVARQALALGISLDTLTCAMLDAAARQHRGNLSAAARSVGLSRRAFDYRRKKHREEQSPAAEAGSLDDDPNASSR
ncbi:MAG: DNA-binding NtrC family response regulator [Chlamydiales bacterium]|jgi:DNA-binding NtrC family response regulator